MECHEKYKIFLSEPCLLNDGDECTLHHRIFQKRWWKILNNVLPCIVFENI